MLQLPSVAAGFQLLGSWRRVVEGRQAVSRGAGLDVEQSLNQNSLKSNAFQVINHLNLNYLTFMWIKKHKKESKMLQINQLQL